MPKDKVPKIALDQLWEKLDKSDSSSLLKKHLSKDRYERVKDLKTKLGGDLGDCIQSGCENLDSGCGIYACDPEGYTVFSDILDEVIKAYHSIPEVRHPDPDFGDLEHLGFENLDPDGEMIVSTRVRVGRSHEGMPFPPEATKETLEEMEKKSREALAKLENDKELKGTYYSLGKMTDKQKEKLIEDHFLFKDDDDRFLRDAGGYNFWPTGRGIYHNDGKTFLVWVNEEDHLRLISMQKGGDLAAVYKRLVKAIHALEQKLTFAKDCNRGYLTFCPTNLGTAMRASVHIKIPKLSKEPDFKKFCEDRKLQPRGIHGEHTESEGGVFDISNKRRMGLTEFQAITEMSNGVKDIIKREKELQAK